MRAKNTKSTLWAPIECLCIIQAKSHSWNGHVRDVFARRFPALTKAHI